MLSNHFKQTLYSNLIHKFYKTLMNKIKKSFNNCKYNKKKIKKNSKNYYIDLKNFIT